MIPRLAKALSSRIPSSLSFALFSTMNSASSSNFSPAQLQKLTIKTLVDDAVNNNQVTIFSKTWCPYCKRVKELFGTQFPDVKPTIFELDERDDGNDIAEYLYEKTGQRTVPNVFINKQHIGGNDDTQALFKSGQLTQQIKAGL